MTSHHSSDHSLPPSNLTNLRLAAEATEMLLRHVALPSAHISAVIDTFSSLASQRGLADLPTKAEAPPPKQSPPTAQPPKAKPVARPRTAPKTRAAGSASNRQPAKKWKEVAPTVAPLTPLEKVRMRLMRDPLRLDDQAAMAVARASGKPVGRDRLEGIEETTDGSVMLKFGFVHGTAKFFVEFAPTGEHGTQAMTALSELASAPA